MLYYQNVYDCLIGKLTLNENEALFLAAIQLLVEFQTSKEFALKGLESNIQEYVPIKLLNKYPSMHWIKLIYDSYLNQCSEFTTKTNYKVKYIQQLQSSHLWEAHQFQIKV